MTDRSTSPRRRDRGAVIPLTALLLVAILGSVAFAVDHGRLRAERRDAQADADVISLDLVRLADGRTEGDIVDSTEYHTVLARAADANDIPVSDLVVEYGTYDADTDSFTPTDSSEVPNAVQVQASGEIDYAFAQVFSSSSGTTSRSAVAGLDSVADLWIGTKLAEMRSGDSARLNFLLENRLGGGEFNISAAGYQGLAASDVTHGDIAAAAGFASPDDFADAELTLAEYADAFASAFSANGEDANAAIAAELADRSREREIAYDRPRKTFTVRERLGLTPSAQGGVFGPDDDHDGWADAQANFLDMFVSAAEFLNGENLTEVCTEVRDFDDGFADVPRDLISFDPVDEILNPTSTTCVETIDSGAQITDGRPGDSATTSQLSVTQTAEGDLDLLGLTGRAIVPATITAGAASAELEAISCDRSGAEDHRADTWIAPKPLEIDVGSDGPEFELVDALGLLRVEVDIDPNLEPDAETSGALIEDQVIDTVEHGPGASPTFGFRLSNSDVEIQVVAGSLGTLSSGDILHRLVPRLNVLLDQIDNRATPRLDAFGIGLSSSDLHLRDVRCDTPLLVG